MPSRRTLLAAALAAAAAPPRGAQTLVQSLNALAARANRVLQSRAALTRPALDDYLDRHRREEVEDGFGLWGRRTVDGLDYQEKARGEW